MNEESINPETEIIVTPEAVDSMIFFICTGLTLAAKYKKVDDPERAIQQLQVISKCLAAYTKLIPLIIEDRTIPLREMEYVRDRLSEANHLLELFEHGKPDPSDIH